MTRQYVVPLLAFLVSTSVYAQDPNSVFINADRGEDEVRASKGDTAAQLRLGYRLLSGTGVAVDSARAVEFFSSATTSGRSVAASAWLGYAYAQTPKIGKAREGIALLEKAARAGDLVGTTLLGRLYDTGMGLPVDKRRAVELYGAAQAFALAKTYLGETYLRTPGASERRQLDLPPGDN